MSLKLQLRMKKHVLQKYFSCHNHAMLNIIIVVNLFICLYEIHFCYSERCQRTSILFIIKAMSYWCPEVCQLNSFIHVCDWHREIILLPRCGRYYLTNKLELLNKIL